MSDPDKFKGTGDVMVEIGPLTIKDDGDNDTFVDWHISHDGQSYSGFRALRSALGDEEFIKVFEEPETVTSSDFEIREPVAFKCQQCNKTYPRTMKARDGVCTDCK